MASKAKMSQATDPARPGGEAQHQHRLPPAASEHAIRGRAYEIYLARGAQPGHELDDWLQAEQELASYPSNSSAE